MRNINENGRSMVEMLGVLAIIGVLSAGGLAGYSKAMFKHKLNNTMDQITMLVTNIRTMYGAQGNYDGLGTDAINLGIIPSVMGSSMTTLTNPFKGKVAIQEAVATDNSSIAAAGAKLNTGSTPATDKTATAFVITYTGLPVEACIALASADFGAGAGSGFIGVLATNEQPANLAAATTAVAAKVGTGVDGRAEGVAYPVDATATDAKTALNACNPTTNAKQETTVSWKFY